VAGSGRAELAGAAVARDASGGLHDGAARLLAAGNQTKIPRRSPPEEAVYFVDGRLGPMARQCEICGKKVQMGNRVETRGKAKYLGGVGTKITGCTRRKFVPNLQRVKVTLPSGQNKSMRVCTQCIRSGSVRKTVRQKPFSVSAAKK
jgi:large subunit ribosomal protein L28